VTTESQLPNAQPIPSHFSPAPPIAENYWTPLRQELHAWFQRNAPTLGQLYEGALRIIFISEFPGRIRFVAHAVREIRNCLPDVITGSRSSGTVQYINKLDEIANDWQKSGFSLEGAMPVSFSEGTEIPSAHIPVPYPLFQKIAALLREHVESRETTEDTAFRLFEGIAPENQKLRDTLRPIIHQWLRVTKWFVKKVHVPHDGNNDVDITEFLSHFELFEFTLGSLVRGFFKTVEGLDEILEDANSRTG